MQRGMHTGSTLVPGLDHQLRVLRARVDGCRDELAVPPIVGELRRHRGVFHVVVQLAKNRSGEDKLPVGIASARELLRNALGHQVFDPPQPGDTGFPACQGVRFAILKRDLCGVESNGEPPTQHVSSFLSDGKKAPDGRETTGPVNRHSDRPAQGGEAGRLLHLVMQCTHGKSRRRKVIKTRTSLCAG